MFKANEPEPLLSAAARRLTAHSPRGIVPKLLSRLMKTKPVCGFAHRWLLGWAVVVLSAFPTLSLSQPSQPVITSIRLQGTNVVVVVSVPPGFQRVTLETRARFDAGAWAPAAVT